jgi:hydroxymethylglutaryl-CoA reductase (NADPH)
MVTVSFILMDTTIITLFLNMRKLGSIITLGISVLLNGTMALVASLMLSSFYYNLRLNWIQLSEALPFLVVAIGFEKPYVLTRAIMESRHADVEDKMVEGVSKVAPALLLDYMVEVSVLGLASLSGTTFVFFKKNVQVHLRGEWLLGIDGAIKDFAWLSAVIVFFDCIFLFTFYLSIVAFRLKKVHHFPFSI